MTCKRAKIIHNVKTVSIMLSESTFLPYKKLNCDDVSSPQSGTFSAV